MLTKYIKYKPLPKVSRDADGFSDLAKRLSKDFVKNYKKSAQTRKKALSTGDIKTAHRLAHTVKGSACLVKKQALAKAAETVENILAKGKLQLAEALSAVEEELKLVLEGIVIPQNLALP